MESPPFPGTPRRPRWLGRKRKDRRHPRGRRRSGYPRERWLDGLADRVEDAADLGAEEDQGDDRDDRDERQDQRVLGKALAFVIGAEGRDECEKLRHGIQYLLSFETRGDERR